MGRAGESCEGQKESHVVSRYIGQGSGTLLLARYAWMYVCQYQLSFAHTARIIINYLQDTKKQRQQGVKSNAQHIGKRCPFTGGYPHAT